MIVANTCPCGSGRSVNECVPQCESCIGWKRLLGNTPVRVPRLWPGETAVILGGGPSLTREDVDFCRGKARVIAVKEAFQLAPWADVLYAADSSWWHYYRGVQEFKGLKYGIRGRTPNPHDATLDQWPDLQVLRDTGNDGLELDQTGLRTGFNSGYQAVNLAVHLGAARIVLLGFDMWSGPNGPNWHTAQRPHRDSPYGLFLARFATLVEPLKAAGVQVVNASRFTVLGAFPRVSIEEALP